MKTFDRKVFCTGAKDGIPVALGYIAVSFAFGVLAAKGGIPAYQAALISLLNVTSAGQFAGLTVILAKGSLMEIALTQAVINLRYALMSLTLSQRIPQKTKVPVRLSMAFGVTDEIFALDTGSEKEVWPAYHFGVMGVAIPGWVLGTYLGAFSGTLLPDHVLRALSVALYGMFLAIIVPSVKRDKAVAGAVLCAMACSALFTYLPLLREVSEGFAVVVITVAVALLFALLFPVKEEESGAGPADGKEQADES